MHAAFYSGVDVFIGEALTRLVVAFALLLCLEPTGATAAGASNAQALPAVVASIKSFEGRLEYTGHRVDGASQPVAGALTVAGDRWILEERTPNSLLHASNDQSWIRTSSQTVVFDDPFEVDALANSWAVMLGSSARAAIAPGATSSSWSVGSSALIYLDAAQSQVIGAADLRSADGVSFAYSDWINVNGLQLPQSIVRMHDGVTVASFLIDGYQVVWAPKDGWESALSANDGSLAQVPAIAASLSSPHLPSPWRPYAVLFSLFVLASGVVAWSRRDALSDRLCRRLATDPRGWQAEGTSVFVSPEGTMFFEGRPYQVGAAFYNRPTKVQSSALFIRVSAPQVPRTVILARKFPLPKILQVQRRPAAGFTLIEALAASALFATVVIMAVFPALVVLAQADRVASAHQAANEVAANAFADEEAALAYGTGITDGSATSVIDGMKLTVTISPAGISGLHNVTVQVANASDHALARIASMLGPPVPPPTGARPPPATR